MIRINADSPSLLVATDIIEFEHLCFFSPACNGQSNRRVSVNEIWLFSFLMLLDLKRFIDSQRCTCLYLIFYVVIVGSAWTLEDDVPTLELSTVDGTPFSQASNQLYYKKRPAFSISKVSEVRARHIFF